MAPAPKQSVDSIKPDATHLNDVNFMFVFPLSSKLQAENGTANTEHLLLLSDSEHERRKAIRVPPR